MSLNRLEKLLVTFTILSCWGIVATAMLFLQQPEIKPSLPTESHVELAEDLLFDEMPSDDRGMTLPAEEPSAATEADLLLNSTSGPVAWLEEAAAAISAVGIAR